MPALPDRETWESRLARAVARALRVSERDALDLLGDPPQMRNLDARYWASVEATMRAEIEPVLRQLYLESAQMMAETATIGVEWGIVNEGAVRWAREWAGGLIKDLTDTTQRTVADVIARAFEEPLNLSQIRDLLAPSFGPVRAEMIAITEVTRASVQGELGIVDELNKQGIRLIAVWQTRNDELVCPICGPNHGKQRGQGWYDPPPAHPRCRCNLSHITELQTTGGLEQIPFYGEAAT